MLNHAGVIRGARHHVRKLLTRNWQRPESHLLATYRNAGGYALWEKTLRGAGMSPQQVTGAVKAAGLRGMGGAGFPAGVKWGFLPNSA